MDSIVSRTPLDLSMQPIYLLDLASRKTAWLAAREAAVAGNIANANTPGYRAKDVASFTDVLAKTQLDLTSTNAAHLPISGADALNDASAAEDQSDVEVTETGNSVGVENQMIKAGDINREFSLTTNIVKTFHAMLMSSLKGT